MTASGHRLPALRLPAAGVASCLLSAMLAACAPARVDRPISWATLAAAPQPVADHRLAFGDAPTQFGDLWLPKGNGPFPVVVLIHGGCWLSGYDLGYMAGAAADLAADGVAVWSLEYRRVGDEGGGWPGTFLDVAIGTAHVVQLARDHPLDLDRVVLAGHSAGGHLSLWLAAPGELPGGGDRGLPRLRPKGVVTLAGIADLAQYARGPGGCNRAVAPLMGGAPEDVPDRYAQADPIRRLPYGVPMRLIQGDLDRIVPVAQAAAFAAAATAAGDDARIEVVVGEGHFDAADPTSQSWAAAKRAIRELLALKARVGARIVPAFPGTCT